MKKNIITLFIFLAVLTLIAWASVRVSLIIFIFLISSKILHSLIKSEKVKNIYKNISFALYGIVLIFLLLELVFMKIPQTHGVGFTKGAFVWKKYYWNTRNSSGYRDKQVDLNDTTKTNIKYIYAVGDSFTEGQGIEYCKDRYSDRLESLLGNGYRVCNLGLCGDHTTNEYARLLDCKKQPDLLVLQYYGNDIDHVALENNLTFELSEPYKKDLNPVFSFFIDKSYLINYLYWQFPHYELNSYYDFLHKAYTDTTIFSKHLLELDKFRQYSEERKVPLIVLVFPYMMDVEGSAFYTKPIEKYLSEKKIDFIDVGELIKNVPIMERIASKKDIHSSELVNEIVANKLFERVKKNHIF